MTDFKATYANYLARLAEDNDHNKKTVFDALEAAGVETVTVDFDGEGDSGNVDEPCFQGGKTDTAPSVTIRVTSYRPDGFEEQTQTLPQAVETLCYGYLAQEHGGWENNEGAFGEFVFDVAGRTIRLEFKQRLMEYETYEHSF
jgi:hypothetical protein